MADSSDARSDEDLARGAADGDRAALETLLARHLDQIHAVCRRVLGHPEDALDEGRRRRRRPIASEHLADISTGVDATVAVDARLDVDAALATIPPDYRAAVALRDLVGLDYAEIAVALDIPIGTVRSRIARGRATMADRIGNRDDPSERPTPRTP